MLWHAGCKLHAFQALAGAVTCPAASGRPAVAGRKAWRRHCGKLDCPEYSVCCHQEDYEVREYAHGELLEAPPFILCPCSINAALLKAAQGPPCDWDWQWGLKGLGGGAEP